MDFFTVCRNLRIQFVKPEKSEIVEKYILDNSEDLSEEELAHAAYSLFKFWKSKGWLVNETFAIILEKDEEALLHDKGITVIKTPDDLPPDQVLLKLIPLGTSDEKVVWF